MSADKKQLAALKQKIADLEKENLHLAEEAEQALHSRIIAEKLELAADEPDMINILVESVVTYNSLFYAAYYQCDAKPGKLRLQSSYCLNSTIDAPHARVTIGDELKQLLQTREGFFDLSSHDLFKRVFIPQGEDFYDIYIAPVYLHEQMRGFLFVANTDSEATEYLNHLNAVLTPAMLMEHQLAQHVHLNELEQEVDKRTQELVLDIQKREEIEQQLIRQEKKQEELLEFSTDLIWEVNPDGTFILVEARSELILGFTADELIGQHLSLVLREDSVKAAMEALESLFTTKEPVKELGLWHRTKAGRSVYMKVSAFPDFDESGQIIKVRGMDRDETNKKRAEDNLRQSQQKLALHFEQTPLGVIEWDTDFHALSWNPAAERIFGYLADEAIGKHPTEIILPAEIRPIVDQVWQELLANKGGTRSTNENITKDGRVITCDWYNTPLVDEQGEVVGVASLIEDITERKQQEAELMKAKVAADLANKAKSDFLANMSHELRTPMHGILSYAEFGLGKTGVAESGKIKKYFSQIKNSGERLLALLNDLLDLSKMESGMMEMELGINDLTGIVDSCIAEQKTRIKEAGICIKQTKEKAVPDVCCDKARIGQVITNLLSNAIKFSPDNSCISFNYSPEKMLNDDGSDCDALRVGISDEGPGVPADELDMVFDKFIQSAKNREKGGTGLGLAISKEIIELHHGKIWAANNDKAGVMFQFVIPLSARQ